MIERENSAGDEIRGRFANPVPARVDAKRITSVASAGAVECGKSGRGVREFNPLPTWGELIGRGAQVRPRAKERPGDVLASPGEVRPVGSVRGHASHSSHAPRIADATVRMSKAVIHMMNEVSK